MIDSFYIEKVTILPPKSLGELSSRWNQIYPSLLNSYEKLKKLGLTHHTENSVIIVSEKEQ